MYDHGCCSKQLWFLRNQYNCGNYKLVKTSKLSSYKTKQMWLEVIIGKRTCTCTHEIDGLLPWRPFKKSLYFLRCWEVIAFGAVVPKIHHEWISPSGWQFNWQSRRQRVALGTEEQILLWLN
ncbi:hypothetical protein NE237_033050 [Protea cynaroides]|uniref:Uncharacterized protein n=1 Tax=Protea cynaroides TaxID=273540 RepID=A0A9Q0R3N5_9MAGN|nr:hypothetical protein NE237_033050 [Protea cynaroides]